VTYTEATSTSVPTAVTTDCN